MSSQQNQQREDPRVKKLRELRKFDNWLGERRDGEWVRNSVCCDPVTRTFEHHTKGKDEDGKPIIVKATVEETVYQHDGYSPAFENEKKARRAFYWRGARVWRD